ncbi:CysJI operon transcriptional activator [Variovorax sp. SRS16]|uniref:LysR family transcriptional regulator n=1 Tax=Variovorax sp. SRS16 TaxID=282217 RepID=UPI001315EA50|nr:LysR family transcriptional regulator [Variovorax sp. SRS16]VTU29512.1 CysJI operon transcriptional activator [Variovorax sp. SRS16]
MRLTLRQLQLFHAIAETHSTTAAAERVALSQSAISSALGELEGVLDVQLFDRIGKRLMLNDNGRMLMPMARALLDAAEEIEQNFQAGEAASIHLRLAASTTIGNYLMPSLLAGFQRAWPQARVELQIGNTQDVMAQAVSLAADLGLIEGPCHDADLMVLPWMDDEMVVVAAPRHPLLAQAEGGRLGVRQLRQARWLLREPGSGTRETVEHALLPHLHQLSEVMTLGSSEAIKNAVAEGLGLSCLSLCVVQDLIRAKRLMVVPSTLPRITRRFSLVHHRRKALSGPLRAFAQHCGIAAEQLQRP